MMGGIGWPQGHFHPDQGEPEQGQQNERTKLQFPVMDVELTRLRRQTA